MGRQFGVISAVQLDVEQTKAVLIDPSDRQLILAGPGSGKTQVVTSLLGHLMEVQGLYPEEIVVISFSRAAVHAARERSIDGVADGRLVSFRTLDSWAASIVLREGDSDLPWRGYDNRIDRALELVQGGADDTLEDVRHIIVDEVQDVVGRRAQFLLALLAAGMLRDIGFTLLGDPMQALYDFQLQGPEDYTTENLLSCVRSLPNVSVVELRESYRARHDSARAPVEARRELLGAPLVGQYGKALALCADLIQLGDLEDEAETVASLHGRTAVLCDTNIRAQKVLDTIREQGFTASLQAAAQEPTLRPELARLFQGQPELKLSRGEFEAELSTMPGPERDRLWLALRDLAGTRGASVDAQKLSRLLSAGVMRPEMLWDPATSVVVSTVHRAKGLEYDNVVLVDPFDWGNVFDRGPDTARMMFVALTRGRDLTCSVDGPDVRGWRRQVGSGRWFKHGRERWQTFGVALRNSDTRGLGPVDLDLDRHVGGAVVWTLDEPDADVPTYVAAAADGTVVARTTADFGDDLCRRLRGGRSGVDRSRWPVLTGGHVEAAETVAGPRLLKQGVPGWGLWVSAQVTGLLSLDWG